MKHLIISIFILTFAQFSFAESQICGSALGDSPYTEQLNLVDAKATVFEISTCDGHTEAFEAVEDWYKKQSEFKNHDYGWFSVEKSNIVDAVKLLEENHSQTDGDDAWSKKQVDTLVEIYTSKDIHKDVYMGEYADSYMSGTGITSLIFMQTEDVSQLIVIEKFVYAE